MREQLPHSLRVADGVLNSNEVWVAYLERLVASQRSHPLRVACDVLNSGDVKRLSGDIGSRYRRRRFDPGERAGAFFARLLCPTALGLFARCTRSLKTLVPCARGLYGRTLHRADAMQRIKQEVIR